MSAITRPQTARIAEQAATCLTALEDDPKAQGGAVLMLLMLAPDILSDGRKDTKKFLAEAGVHKGHIDAPGALRKFKGK